MCTSCNIDLPDDSFIQDINKEKKITTTYIQLHDTILCPNCCTRVNQIQKMDTKNKLLIQYMGDTICRNDRSWDKHSIQVIPTLEIMNALIPSISKDEPIMEYLSRSIRIQLMSIDTDMTAIA